MRLTLDTNVIIDGVLDEMSAPARLIGLVLEGSHEALVSEEIVREYRRMIRSQVHNSVYTKKIDKFLICACYIDPRPVDVPIDDEDDRKFLEVAHGGDADLLVTRDAHLLDIKRISSTRIVTPQEAIDIIESDIHDDSSSWQRFARDIGIGVAVMVFFGLFPATVFGTTSQEYQKQLDEKKQAIAKLDEQIRSLRSQRTVAKSDAEIISGNLDLLQKEFDRLSLELGQTSIRLNQTKRQQDQIEGDIGTLNKAVGESRARLKNLVRALYEKEQKSLVRLFFERLSLSDVFMNRAIYRELQARTVALVRQMKQQETDLTSKRNELDQHEQDLGKLEQLLSDQTDVLAQSRAERAEFYHKKREEQKEYEHLIAEAKKARAEIDLNLYRVESSNVQVVLTDAFDMAKFASISTGVRAAILLAVLKVESNLGNNVGTGRFPDDMHPGSRDAFVRITKKLGMDPLTVPVARKPSNGRGWGGAMGPAQIMPATWETIEQRLSQITGKDRVNPFDLADAFVATAVFLAERGAAQPTGEREAIGRYVAGPNWNYYSWYIDKVFAVASEYERALSSRT